jgi:hypothetical protein
MEEFNTDLFASNQKSPCPHIHENYFTAIDGDGRLCEVESCFPFIKMLRFEFDRSGAQSSSARRIVFNFNVIRDFMRLCLLA